MEVNSSALLSKGSREPGFNHMPAKLAKQDALPGITANSFLYNVSLPAQITMEIKQEGPAGRHGANTVGENLRPRLSGEAKVPSSQEFSDCCGNGLNVCCPRSGCPKACGRAFMRCGCRAGPRGSIPSRVPPSQG